MSVVVLLLIQLKIVLSNLLPLDELKSCASELQTQPFNSKRSQSSFCRGFQLNSSETSWVKTLLIRSLEVRVLHHIVITAYIGERIQYYGVF